MAPRKEVVLVPCRTVHEIREWMREAEWFSVAGWGTGMVRSWLVVGLYCVTLRGVQVVTVGTRLGVFSKNTLVLQQ